MTTKNDTNGPSVIPKPKKLPEVNPLEDPDERIIPEEDDPDIIPDEDEPFENPPPYELPEPGEGP